MTDSRYKDDIELPKIYNLTTDNLNLAPDQHTEQIFKQILGGRQTVVEGLGAGRKKNLVCKLILNPESDLHFRVFQDLPESIKNYTVFETLGTGLE